MTEKEIKELEKIATELTGIEPIYNKEYVKITYQKNNYNCKKQVRSNPYKTDRRFL